jgi:hypothetical protein
MKTGGEVLQDTIAQKPHKKESIMKRLKLISSSLLEKQGFFKGKGGARVHFQIRGKSIQ